MTSLWSVVCCCFPQDSVQSTPAAPKSSRIRSKYSSQQIMQLSDVQRKAQPSKAYCCPICTNYFNRILACSSCSNQICRKCCESYEETSRKRRTKMKCAFCASNKSKFVDCDIAPHSYFNATGNNNGFLTKELRLAIEREIQQKQTNNGQLEHIEERQSEAHIQTDRMHRDQSYSRQRQTGQYNEGRQMRQSNQVRQIRLTEQVQLINVVSPN